jgi:DNA-binding beta-propeller fold protein YncE
MINGAPSLKLGIFFVSVFLVAALVPVSAFAAGGSPFASQFTLFDSGQVRPLALSENGDYLYAANTPDNRLEIFRVNANSNSQALTLVGSVRVGLEPVAVAVRSRREVWVVNHLSDSISVVDVTTAAEPFVEKTLLVGDEPRDVVFAGPGRNRAFVTTAHRGQNSPIDPQLTTPGVGRADVWVFDARDAGDGPITIISLFADTPRALAVSPDGAKVYAAGFHSGNQTTTIFGLAVTDGNTAAADGFGLPAPATNFQGIHQPEEGLIVKFDGQHWRDQATGRIWDSKVNFNLPDRDVFTIDAMANPPAPVANGSYSGVGTVLFNMAVNPVSGKLYVSNTEARNEVRFEGPGIHGGSTVRGHLHEARISVLSGGAAVARHLNKHIDYEACCEALPNSTNARSLAQPLEMAVSSDGRKLYVAAFGSGKIGIFDTAALENDSFVPNAADHVELSGGGPTGLVLDGNNRRLYVLTRFDNTVTVVDTATKRELARRPLFNPEPLTVKAGRSLLYDARRTSSNGESACGSCHVFGDLDSLAWDLGNPDGEVVENPGPFLDSQAPFPGAQNFQPMKGPMVTQSLRGLANHGPMHWRGDRNGNNEAAESAQPDTGLYDERQAFREFNPAFESLLGNSRQLAPAEMEALTDYVLELTYPPNPLRNLDNSLTPAQARGRAHFFKEDVAELNPLLPSPLTSCNGCHTLDPNANAQYGVKKPGLFGASGLGVVDTIGLQHIKAPQMRNLYQKIGMFGAVFNPFLTPGSDFSHQGDQIRGFGFTHDGSADTVFRFLSAAFFADVAVPGGFPFSPAGDPARRDVESFLLAFDSNLAPVVGQQITLDRTSGSVDHNRASLLLQRAAAGECEVVATIQLLGQERSFLYLAFSQGFRADENGSPILPDLLLRLASLLKPVTYTAVPVGSGQRVGLDSDLDGCWDGSEERAGYDPRNPASKPPGCR